MRKFFDDRSTYECDDSGLVIFFHFKPICNAAAHIVNFTINVKKIRRFNWLAVKNVREIYLNDGVSPTKRVCASQNEPKS